MTLESEIDTALEKLKAVIDPAEEYYGCAWHNGNLSLNTSAAYERMPKKNHIWEPDDWEGAGLLKDWFNADVEAESDKLLLLLTTIHENRTEIFGRVTDYFAVLYLSGEDKAIGLEKIQKLFSTDHLLGKDYYNAVTSGDLVQAATLLGQIHDADLQVDTGEFFKPSLLEIAVKHSAMELIRILADRGADLEDGCRWTHDPVLLTILTDLGAPIDLGYERLIAAASEDETLPELKFLLEKGADINAQNPDGQTPLIRAAGNGNIQTVEYLLARGARTGIKSKYGDVFEVADSDRMQTILAPHRAGN